MIHMSFWELSVKYLEPGFIIHLHTTMVMPVHRFPLGENCSSGIRTLEEHPTSYNI